MKSEVKEWRHWNEWLCFEGRCSIQLSYGRVVEISLIVKHLSPFQKSNPLRFSFTVPEMCQNPMGGEILAQCVCHFVGLAVEFVQCFSSHLQLHLRILLEDLRTTAAKHLCDPLIGYAPSALVVHRALGGHDSLFS